MKALATILVFGMVILFFGEIVFASEEKNDRRQSMYTAKYYGVIENLPKDGWEGIWVVNGREILVTGNTEIEEKYGKIAVGAYVEVEGNYVGKTFTAYEIEVKGDKDSKQIKPYNSKFYGTVEGMPGEGYEGLWIVDEREVIVDGNTIIEEKHGKASVGAYVKVKGRRAGKTFTAYEIEVKENRR